MQILRFVFTADASSVDKESKRGKKALQDLRKEFREGISTSAKWGVAMAAAGTAIGAHLVKQSMEAIDAQAKLARTLQGTVSQVEALNKVASDAGVDGMDASLMRLNRRLGAVERGGGPAAAAISRLNLNAKELAEMPLDERLATISDAFKNSGMTMQEAARAAQDLGFEQAAAAQMFMQGGDAIRQATADIERYGLAISDVDAAKVEQAKGALDNIRMATSGIIKQMTVQLAPVITAIAKLFEEAAVEGRDFGETAERGMGGLVTAIGFVLDALESIKRVFSIVADSLIIGFESIKKKILSDMLAIAKAINMIPGVNMDKAVSSLEGMVSQSESIIRHAMQNIKDTLDEPLPSTAFKQFVEDAKEAAQEAAEAAVAAREGMGGSGVGGSFLSEAELKAMEERLEKLQESFLTEQELLAKKYEEELVLLEESLENKLLTQEEYDELMLAAKEQYEDRLTAIEEKASQARQRIAEMEARAKRDAIGKMMSDLTTLMNSESRRQFEIGKAAAISQTVADTWVGAQKAFNALADIPVVGPALGAAAAVAAGLAGMQRVQAIRSQSFGGSGGSAAAASNTEAVNAASTPVGGQQQTQVMRVEGLDRNSLFSGDAVETIARGLLDFQKDGGQVVFAG